LGAFVAYYVFATTLGTSSGGAIGLSFGSYLLPIGGRHIAQSMVQETVGSFILVFCYLTQTEEKYKLSNDPAITTMIISGAYVVAMWLGFSGIIIFRTISPLNPAIALGVITMITFKGDMNTNLSWSWIYLVFGWAGSLLAVALYEFGFKTATDVAEVHNEQAEEEAEAALMSQ
jgi:glycerol uptake facilitator-like aquaporin